APAPPPSAPPCAAGRPPGWSRSRCRAPRRRGPSPATPGRPSATTPAARAGRARRWRRPGRADGGGRWRCRRARPATRCAPRARRSDPRPPARALAPPARSAGCAWRSPALEARLALLQEGGDALAVVGRLATAEVRHGLAVEHGAEVGGEREVHVLLHVAVADERPVRDARGDLAHLVQEGVVREDAVHEPERRGLLGRDEVGQEEELLRLGRADP